MAETPPLLELARIRREFSRGRRWFRELPPVVAVDGVDLAVGRRETVGVVGESGSGKSTLGRIALRLIDPTDGRVHFDGQDITELGGHDLRHLRSRMQAVFQDVTGSLNPRMPIGRSIAEPLWIHDDGRRQDQDERVGDLLDMVGLSSGLADRYPYELSGGQRQRVAIARALAPDPELVVLDEPVSALDASTQSQIVNLLMELQETLGVSYLFVAHDLFVVHHVSTSIAVMYLGDVVERGTADQVYERPRHPYTEALLSAVTHPDPEVERTRERIVLRGDVPSPTAIPSGCRFHTRCPYAFDPCADVDPEPTVFDDGGVVACHLHTDGPMLRGQTVRALPIVPGGRRGETTT